MTIEQQRAALSKLRDLQGTPLTALAAMFILSRPAGKHELATLLRRSEPTISAAIDFLEVEGYIVRENYRQWALAAGQLFLPGFELLPAGSRNPKNFSLETKKSLVSGTCTVLTTTTSNSSTDRVVVSKEPETQKTLVSGELAQALGEIRIGGEAVSRRAWPKLAALEWVTPDYLSAMAGWVSEHNDPRKRTVGFFIHCVKSGDVVPEARSDDDRQKYIAGEFAEYIQS
ncbi:MAG: hypothetical protein B6I35_04500 [Anaerolineaceae bacterium 4572_32.2]|nr:MAG: hypothetical protein B6I35_04500 [Anaerolineaceae bacterium 4572_32.2]